MNVVEIDPITDPRWLTFIEHSPRASIFHHPAWLKVLSETYGYSPVCLAATDLHVLLGILPLIEVRSWLTGDRAVCLPFSDSCGAAARDSSAVQALLQKAKEFRDERGWKYVEIRDSTNVDGFRRAGRYKLHHTDLGGDPAMLFSRFKKTQVQQPILKAKKLGVLVQRRKDAEAVRAFIRLNALTRRKHGVPPQPDSFFWNLSHTVLEAGLGFIGTATQAGQIVATALFLHWKNTITYKYAAADERARSLNASHAVIWDAMCWGCEQQFASFDLGRSDPTNAGLLQFKRGWASEESELSYVRYGSSISDQTSEGIGALSRLKPFVSRIPLPILKLIGRKLYAHIG